jgi:hypothetical protein
MKYCVPAARLTGGESGVRRTPSEPVEMGATSPARSTVSRQLQGQLHTRHHREGGAVEYRQRMAVREILLFTERLPVIDASRVRNFIDQIRNRQIVAAGGSRTKFVIFWGDFVNKM